MRDCALTVLRSDGKDFQGARCRSLKFRVGRDETSRLPLVRGEMRRICRRKAKGPHLLRRRSGYHSEISGLDRDHIHIDARLNPIANPIMDGIHSLPMFLKYICMIPSVNIWTPMYPRRVLMNLTIGELG